MKQFLAILCLLLPVALSSPASANAQKAPVDSSRVTSPDNHIIPGERIGAIRFGMGMDEVQAMLGKPSGWVSERGGSKAFTNSRSWTYGDLNLVVMFGSGAAPVVTGINTSVWPGTRKAKTFGTTYWKDIIPAKVIFKTTEGITLGSSAFDVRRAYGSGDTSGDVVMNYKSLGLSFWTTMDHIVMVIEIRNPQ